jgi:pyruvate/2-oxoacid:ferredoxin oxidoreductase beta subunit
MAGTFVSGTTGGQFRGLTGYSYVIKTNQVADDMIARVEIPYDPLRLTDLTIDPANTFVARMAADNKSWVVEDSAQNINASASLSI